MNDTANATIASGHLIDPANNRVTVLGGAVDGYVRVRFTDGTENSFPIDAVTVDSRPMRREDLPITYASDAVAIIDTKRLNTTVWQRAHGTFELVEGARVICRVTGEPGIIREHDQGGLTVEWATSGPEDLTDRVAETLAEFQGGDDTYRAASLRYAADHDAL